MKHDTKADAAILRRLKIVEGQVRGLREMVERGAYCIDVITQSTAVREAISGVENALLESHLKTCVIEQIRSGKEKKPAEELMKVFAMAKKRR